MLKPLRPGDQIALVAPSSPFEIEKYSLAVDILQSKGYRISLGTHLLNQNGYLAGKDRERTEDLIQAILDPETTAIVCIRGGYGSGRLLEWLPFSLLEERPKIFLGHSDITFLHLAFHGCMDWVTFHGPNLLDMAEERGRLDQVLGALSGDEAFSWDFQEHQVLRRGRASGMLLGGNLTCLSHLLGTRFCPSFDGSLLLVEDRGEALYRLDRLFVHLKHRGVFDNLAGLVLGQFKDCGEPELIREMVLEHLEPFSFPVVCDLPFGHGLQNHVIPFGVPFTVDSSALSFGAAEHPFERPAKRKRFNTERTRKPAEKRAHPSGGSSVLDLSRALERLFEEALSNRVFSGASLLVGTSEAVTLHKAWGKTRRGGDPIDSHTLFDLASLTKALVTAPLYMHAIGRSMFDLDDPLNRFFPRGMLPADKSAITVRQLLNHCSGLPPYEPFYRELIKVHPSKRPEQLLSWILETSLLESPGNACHYSDLGFILLGMILETAFESSLETLAGKYLFPLLSIETTAPYSQTSPKERDLPKHADSEPPMECAGGHANLLKFIPLIAAGEDPTSLPTLKEDSSISYVATEFCPWRGRLIQGEVHDENAYCLGGVAGHAGLFGTAYGVFLLLSFLWKVYRREFKHQDWPPHLLQAFWQKQNLVRESPWALGFDCPSGDRSSAGNYFSSNTIGHLGFTGTSFWMDLDREIIVILLTNRVHFSRENEKVKIFRPLLHNLVMETLRDH